jgi:hypothetical protein
VEQWTESRYPSFIIAGAPIPSTSDDWYPGLDARIKQLPSLASETDPVILAARAAKKKDDEAGQLTNDDYLFLAKLFGGLILLVLGLGTIGVGSVWWLTLREGAPYAVRFSPFSLSLFSLAFSFFFGGGRRGTDH